MHLTLGWAVFGLSTVEAAADRLPSPGADRAGAHALTAA